MLDQPPAQGLWDRATIHDYKAIEMYDKKMMANFLFLALVLVSFLIFRRMVFAACFRALEKSHH